MKTLALSIALALSLGAESLPKPTALTAEEHDRLVLLVIDYYSARVRLLESLAASKAGNAEVTASTQAERTVTEYLAQMRKAHGATDPCMWKFDTKEWACPKE